MPGSAILVNWTVVNQGEGDTAVSTWQDEVFIDTGSTLDSNAVLVGSFTHNGLIDAGGSYSQSQLVTLPINLLGTYNLFVVTNTSNSVYESDTSNDTSAPVPITIALKLTGGGGTGGHGTGGGGTGGHGTGGGGTGGHGTGGGGTGGHGTGGGGSGGVQQARVSDLQPTSVTGPGIAVSAGSLTLDWTVTNNGPGTTNSNYWYDDLWMSTDTTLGSGGTDVFLGSLQHTNPLASGSSYTASATFTLPSNMAAGNYYFIVVTNATGLVYESNTSNDALASSATTAVTVAISPDLTVSNVTTSSTATSGGQLSVGWTVTNTGGDTGNVPITDSVYLSYDQVFDPTDRYIGSVTEQGGLAAGADYTQDSSFSLPPGMAGTFYVIVETNSNDQVDETNTSNNTAFAPQPVQISLPPQADLVAGTVTIPANALAGQDITVSYQVTNGGGNPADGSWVDSLYLSPTPNWVVSDPLLGQVHQTQDVAPGGSYTGSLTAPVPGVTPGSYYVILRTNILDTLPESTLTNNLSASLTQTAIDAPELTLGTTIDGTLDQGQYAYYKVEVSFDQTLSVLLSTTATSADNELYVSFGTMPTRSQYDFRFEVPGADQQILVPTTQQGSYYILAYASSLGGGAEPFSLTANLVPFSLLSIDQSAIGNSGNATIDIRGSMLDTATSFVLMGPNGTAIAGQNPLEVNSTNVYETFDTTGALLGSYSLIANASDGTTSTLTNVLQVVPEIAPQIDFHVSLPSAILPGSVFDAEIVFRNAGNVDTSPPIIYLDSGGTASLGLSAGSFSGTTLDLLARSPDGPGEILRPGESVTETVYAKDLMPANSSVTIKSGIVTDSK